MSLSWDAPEPATACRPASSRARCSASTRFDRFKSERDDDGDGGLESLELSGDAAVDDAALSAPAWRPSPPNAARDLQNLPANVATPELPGRARRRDRRRPRGARGRAARPRRDRGPRHGRVRGRGPGHARGAAADRAPLPAGGRDGPHLGYVGKAVTFDTGGISIKPAAKMQEMKFDMSGGAAVIESMAGIAALGLPVDRDRGRALHREHAERPRGQARRHRHRDERQDDRGQQHRRRGPPDPGRRPLLRRRAGRRADRGPRHAHRGDPRGARAHLRRPLRERRRLVRRHRRRPATPPARSAGGCRSTPSTSS